MSLVSLQKSFFPQNINRRRKQDFIVGTVDLIMEASFLQNLNHENIIDLSGIVFDDKALADGGLSLV